MTWKKGIVQDNAPRLNVLTFSLPRLAHVHFFVYFRCRLKTQVAFVKPFAEFQTAWLHMSNGTNCLPSTLSTGVVCLKGTWSYVCHMDVVWKWQNGKRSNNFIWPKNLKEGVAFKVLELRVYFFGSTYSLVHITTNALLRSVECWIR